MMSSVNQYTWQEVRKHTTKEQGIWIVMNGNIYDITNYISDPQNKHPNTISPFYGEDITGAFRGIVHSQYARKFLSKFKIGELSDKAFGDGTIPCSKFKPIKIPQLKPRELRGIRIKAIHIYPIKGCKFIPVSHAYVANDGIINDRIYAFVNKYNKKVINQLFFPKLSQIQPGFIDPNIPNFDSGIRINNEIVPLINNKESELLVTWRSCKTPIKVYDQGERINKWITNYVCNTQYGANKEFMLVRIAKDNYREAARYYSVMKAGKANDMSGFQNYYTVSVVSQESLDECNRRLIAKKKQPLTWKTQGFRLNVIVDGLPAPHYEDYMKNIVFKSLRDPKNDVECVWSRRRFLCAVPCVDQITSEVNPEPMETLSEYRDALNLNDRISPPGDDSVFFGSFFAIKQAGMIQVGMPIITKYIQTDSHRIWNTHYGFTKKYKRFEQRCSPKSKL